MQHSPVYPTSLPWNPEMMTSPIQDRLKCKILAEEISTRISSIDKKLLSCKNLTLCIISARIQRSRKREIKTQETRYINMRTASFQSLKETAEAVQQSSTRKENSKKKNIYLNLYWSTKAIAIYFPDKIQREIYSPLIDMHCKKGTVQNPKKKLNCDKEE